MSFSEKQKTLFDALKVRLFNELKSDEELNLTLKSEDTLYVRLNDAKVRQNTEVEQSELELSFQSQGRQLKMRTDLSGQLDADLVLLQSLVKRARHECQILPADPGVTKLQNRGTSFFSKDAAEVSLDEVFQVIQNQATGTGFTGFLAAGPQIQANANSTGQNHWFSNRSFFLDYSLYTLNAQGENKAVKDLYADQIWSTEKFTQNLASNKHQLSLLKRANKDVKPGAFRTYLAPAAVAELLELFSWGALSYGAYRRGLCALAKMQDQGLSFSNLFNLRENFDLGVTTPFNSLGEVPNRQVELISKGKLRQMQLSSRSAQEFGVDSNFADHEETLRSADLAGGDLPEKDVLKALGTGLYLGNLHYLNWSDLQTARITGMTRYACFWVENGEIVAPIKDLRFDESLFSLCGPALEALTVEQSLHSSTATYHRRAFGGDARAGITGITDEFHALKICKVS